MATRVGVGLAEAGSQKLYLVFHKAGRGSDIWTIFSCLPNCVSRTLHWGQRKLGLKMEH